MFFIRLYIRFTEKEIFKGKICGKVDQINSNCNKIELVVLIIDKIDLSIEILKILFQYEKKFNLSRRYKNFNFVRF